MNEIELEKYYRKWAIKTGQINEIHLYFFPKQYHKQQLLILGLMETDHIGSTDKNE